MAEYLSLCICTCASIMLLVATIAFFKARDVFTMTKIVMICNSYVVPLLLIGIEIEKFSWQSFAKICVIIVLNLIVTHIVCNAILRKSFDNKDHSQNEIIKAD